MFAQQTACLPFVIVGTFADMVELADTPDLGSGAQACRFKSCYPHFVLKGVLMINRQSSFFVKGNYISYPGLLPMHYQTEKV